MKILAPLFACLALASCASLVYTPEEEAYIKRVSETRTTWKIPAAVANDLRGKAQVHINKYSPMKVQTTTDYVINTYNPTPGKYGYNVTIEPQGDSLEVTVDCVYELAGKHDFTGMALSATRNEKIMALYLQTGEIMPQMISK